MQVDTGIILGLAQQIAALAETVDGLAERIEQSTTAEEVMRRARYDAPEPSRRRPHHLRSVR